MDQAREQASGEAVDLDAAQRSAVDWVVVRKIRQTLEYLDQQPGGRGRQ
jgi:hypothetical protein